MKILDTQLGRTEFVAGDAFTMGDIPVGVMAYRYWQLVPERPELPHLQVWYAALQKRAPFRNMVEAIPLS
jgi:glutathione S-transferase